MLQDPGSIDVTELHKVPDQLARVGQYLAKIDAQLSDSEEEPSYCLDWEMLQEAIYPDDSASVYSPLIWYALECIEAASDKTEAWQLLIPEGTRIELLRHLRSLLKVLRDSERSLLEASSISKTAEKSLGTLPLYWSTRRDWKNTLQHISALQRASQAVRILLYLLGRYCRPVPEAVSLNSRSRTTASRYEDELSLVRNKKSDRADAVNLATVSALRRQGSSRKRLTTSVQLVTGSQTLWKLSPTSCVDPFYLVLEADFRRRFKQKSARKVAIASTISDIYRILARITPYETKQYLLRGEVNIFMHLLDGLSDDQVLREVGQLLSSCSQAVVNARQQARVLQDDASPEFSGLARLRAIHSQALLLARGLGVERSADALGLRAMYEDSHSGILSWRLVAVDDKELIGGKRFNKTITLAWATPLSLFDFGMKVRANVSDAGEWAVTVRTRAAPGVETLALGDLAQLVQRVVSATHGQRLAFLRLQRDMISLWYVPHQVGAQDGAKKPSHAVISVRTPVTGSAEWLGPFYADTAEEWYFPDVINGVIEQFKSMRQTKAHE